MAKGIFIALEGGEATGKTTTAKVIKEKLEALGHEVVVTREPGGIPSAEAIRENIMNFHIDARTELLLYIAARREHLVSKVIPALEAGKIVITDRFYISSLVYQGHAIGLGIVVVAGKDGKTVKVTLEENAIASLNKRQDVYFNVEGANIVKDTLKVVEGAAGIVHQELDKDKEEVEGLVLDTALIEEGKINKIEFEFEVEGKVEQAGDITLVAESRNFDKNIELKLGTVKEAVKVEAEAMTVKVGLKDQKGGKVVITETEAEMLPRGKQIVVEVAKDSKAGINVVDAKVEAEDVQIKNVKVKDGKIFFTIDRESNELGKITISEITVDTDRTVPEGKFDLVIGGEAISKYNTTKEAFEDAITVADFFVVGTPNTEDNAANGLAKGTGSFKIGEKTYTVNGEVKEMDATAFISKSNRVMVPVKYVSDVFGVNGKDVLFSKENGGTITIFAGSRVLQVVNGSNIALVNGVKVPMDEKVTIIDGRTYVPVGEMGRLLNVDVEWSNETKTATFTNR